MASTTSTADLQSMGLAAASQAAEALAVLIECLRNDEPIDAGALEKLADATRLVATLEDRHEDQQLIDALEKWLDEHGLSTMPVADKPRD